MYWETWCTSNAQVALSALVPVPRPVPPVHLGSLGSLTLSRLPEALLSLYFP